MRYFVLLGTLFISITSYSQICDTLYIQDKPLHIKYGILESYFKNNHLRKRPKPQTGVKCQIIPNDYSAIFKLENNKIVLYDIRIERNVPNKQFLSDSIKALGWYWTETEWVSVIKDYEIGMTANWLTGILIFTAGRRDENFRNEWYLAMDLESGVLVNIKKMNSTEFIQYYSSNKDDIINSGLFDIIIK
jgi:hypothetical protein